MRSETKNRWMIALSFIICHLSFSPAGAQTLLSLDSCRVMALRNSKQIGVAEVKQDVAKNLRRSARTKYLPHVSAIGTYQYTSEELSLLNDQQKTSLSNIGTTAAGGLQGDPARRPGRGIGAAFLRNAAQL